MYDREHKVLDGELTAAELTPEERLRLASLAAATKEAAEALRSIPSPDLSARVLAAVEVDALAASGRAIPMLGRLRGWLWKPRTLTLSWRPVYAAFAAATLLVFAISSDQRRPLASGEELGEPPAVAVLYVQFKLEAPGASSVELVGSFTKWAPGVQLTEATPGVWSTLVALEPGVHDYTFIIDGTTWVIDPMAPAVDNGFGGANSRLFLTSPLGNA